jgi:hypothetical protein
LPKSDARLDIFHDLHAAAFLFPASAKDVRQVSNTFFPPSLATGDQRDLGVMLAGLSFSGSLGGDARRISLDDRRLCDGFHPIENHAVRSGAGRGAKPSSSRSSGSVCPVRLRIPPAQSQLEIAQPNRPKLCAIK